jgi:hypothetical protein
VQGKPGGKGKVLNGVPALDVEVARPGERGSKGRLLLDPKE